MNVEARQQATLRADTACPGAPDWDWRRAVCAFATLFCLLLIVPFALVDLPSMVDLPGHIGRYHVMLEGDRSPWLQRYFDFRWLLVGNLGVDLIVYALGPLLGVERAALVTVAAIPLLTVAGILAVSRAVHGRIEPGAALAGCFVLSNPFMYGFVNYALAAALAFLAFAAWIATRDRAMWRSWLAMAPFALLVWLCHAAGWALLLLAVAGYEGWRLLRAPFAAWRRAVPALLARILPLLIPIALTLAWREGASADLYLYRSDLIEHKLFHYAAVLRGHSMALDIGTPLLIGLALAALLLAGRLRIEPRLAMPAALLFAATLLMPTAIFGSWHADERLVPAVAILACLSFAWRGGRREALMLAAFGLALFAARTLWIAKEWVVLDRAYSSHLRALEGVPRGARIFAVTLHNPCDQPWSVSSYLHLANLAIVRRDAFVNTTWALEGAPLMRVVYDVPADYRTDPSQMIAGFDCRGRDMAPLQQRLAALPRDRFDFVWVLRTQGLLPPLNGLGPPVYADGNSALYPVGQAR